MHLDNNSSTWICWIYSGKSLAQILQQNYFSGSYLPNREPNPVVGSVREIRWSTAVVHINSYFMCVKLFFARAKSRSTENNILLFFPPYLALAFLFTHYDNKCAIKIVTIRFPKQYIIFSKPFLSLIIKLRSIVRPLRIIFTLWFIRGFSPFNVPSLLSQTLIFILFFNFLEKNSLTNSIKIFLPLLSWHLFDTQFIAICHFILSTSIYYHIYLEELYATLRNANLSRFRFLSVKQSHKTCNWLKNECKRGVRCRVFAKETRQRRRDDEKYKWQPLRKSWGFIPLGFFSFFSFFWLKTRFFPIYILYINCITREYARDLYVGVFVCVIYNSLPQETIVEISK